tara:strand:- start:16138 stop:16815 length:678 start_codon:yes stop_codon:yes gene_type:complete
MISLCSLQDSWKKILENEFHKNYMKKLNEMLILEEKKYNIFPNKEKIFNALNKCPFNKVKIVIIGQDPYHGYRQANGIAFSVNKKMPIPPSLRNIFKEIKRDLSIENSKNGDLSNWAKQGILLLNTSLTVRENKPKSHSNIGWKEFTDTIISKISQKKNGIIFLLWGLESKKKSELIDSKKHYILMSSHPSPLSSYRGFNGCGHFSKCNNILNKIGKKTINWKIT